MKALFILIVWCVFALPAQGQNCHCAENHFANVHPTQIFHLSNGKSIALCGARDTIKGKVYFSEFVLSPCGSNKIIAFWGAVDICRVTVVKDTLLVYTMYDLPVGKHMKYTETIWMIERIFYNKGQLKHTLDIDRQFPKYNAEQIAAVLKLYENAPNKLSDQAIQIADQLFVSTVSGSQQARKYLTSFTKFKKQLDGAYSEAYHALIAMLKLWDQHVSDPALARQNIPLMKPEEYH